MYYFSNGDEEKRIYKKGILDGESTTFKKRWKSSEIRVYKKGILQGEAIFKKDNQVKKILIYWWFKRRNASIEHYLQ